MSPNDTYKNLTEKDVSINVNGRYILSTVYIPMNENSCQSKCITSERFYNVGMDKRQLNVFTSIK